MKRLRLRVIMLTCWLVLFYSAQRLTPLVDLSDLTSFFVLMMIIVNLVIPRLVRISYRAVLVVSTIILLGIETWRGLLFVDSTTVAMAVLEVSAITVTTFLAHSVSMSIVEFESVIQKITIGRREKMPESSAVGQGFIYREVRRARNHQRPLALITISVNERTIDSQLDRMVREVQLSMMKQFKIAGISKLLCDELEDCAVIAQDGDNFLVALPETKPDEVPIVIKRLRQKITDQVGVSLLVGSAVLPRDGLTFEGLLDKANLEMMQSKDTEQVRGFDRLPI